MNYIAYSFGKSLVYSVVLAMIYIGVAKIFFKDIKLKSLIYSYLVILAVCFILVLINN